MNTNTRTLSQEIATQNEQTWIRIGKLSESLIGNEKAISCYEQALRVSPYSESALASIGNCYTAQESYPQALEYFQRIINYNPNAGESWSALGHCYLMMDDLQKAYSAYQQALYHLKNPKDPKLWYGIGILYDRYGSFEHAEEAFHAVIKMDSQFDKLNEIYFRLGIIYKTQGKLDHSYDCFHYILTCPPSPLTRLDILFQIGHVYEQKKNYVEAKNTYELVLKEAPNHAKVLQQLGWLYQDSVTPFQSIDTAISLLSKSLDADARDAQTWYLLGRCYMEQQKFTDAYDAYQQAVYRDGKNPTFWCSIGVLYYQINQYTDALDAYGRAIRLNPYISEVWFDLGTLYESCNNQLSDALDAYTRAFELDPDNMQIKERIEILRRKQLDARIAPAPPSTTSSMAPSISSIEVSPVVRPNNESTLGKMNLAPTLTQPPNLPNVVLPSPTQVSTEEATPIQPQSQPSLQPPVHVQPQPSVQVQPPVQQSQEIQQVVDEKE